jgi:glycyl-tRNA synthetase alpha subunit
MVLAILRRAASFDRPCPTNREIMRGANTLAGRTLFDTPDAAGYRFNKLEAAGYISVADRGSRVTRVVTICATGKTTSRAMTPVQTGAVR